MKSLVLLCGLLLLIQPPIFMLNFVKIFNSIQNETD